MQRYKRARYTAWNGSAERAGFHPDDVLESLSDRILSDGVESAMNKALHQGMSAEDGDRVEGLDRLRDQVRAEQRAAIADLANQIQTESISDAAASGTDEDLKRLIAALRTRTTSLVGALSDASAESLDDFGSLLEASSPGESVQPISDQIARLLDLGTLERQLRSLRAVADLHHLDLQLLQRLLGQDTADATQALIESLRSFADSGYVLGSGKRAALSSRAVQKIGDSLLQTVLARVESRTSGQHVSRQRGLGHEQSGVTRSYTFGDPFDLDLAQTVMGAVKRRVGTPVRISIDDLRIHDRESSQRATTILAVDLSRSMGERGYLLAAKELALALGTFIRTRYPQDELLLVGFSESARQMKLHELIELQWDRYGFGTNIQDALRLSASILNSHRGRRRNLVLITDGEPTAHRETGGGVVFNHPPSDETIARTYREAQRLREDGVYMCVCVMSAQKQVTAFGRELARYAAGDALVTDPENLSADLIVTYNGRR